MGGTADYIVCSFGLDLVACRSNRHRSHCTGENCPRRAQQDHTATGNRRRQIHNRGKWAACKNRTGIGYA